jgi:predicted nucleic acid-binding protein
MTCRLLDASAVIAVIIEEPEGSKVIELTKESVLVSPYTIRVEIANALTRMMRRHILAQEGMLKAFELFEALPIDLLDVDFKRVLEIAWTHKIYAYDACYLEVAQRLNLPLITFDKGMAKAGNNMGLTILGGKYDEV